MNSFTPPTFLKHDVENLSFSVSLTYGTITENDESTLLVDRKSKGEKIRERLDPFLNLVTYVINITKVEFEFQIQSGYVDHYEKLFISVKFQCELIKPEDYYETIGFYKSLLNNVCNKGFKVDDLLVVAKDLQINIEGLNKAETCRVLSQRVNNLTYKDFQ
ncbi:Hypothetical protein POVR1_LOCUS558 [uncultured virus]|nr:Hypothetical protein POVR1_LOCUS558 [uncultured virus]